MGRKDTAVFASSDHGFAPQWLGINARKLLFDKTVRNTLTGASVPLQASGGTGTGNCTAAATDLAKACWAGGTAQVYVNPTLPAGITYEAVRSAAIDALKTLVDPDEPGRPVMLRVLKKEELGDVDGTDSLHPTRSGDVVWVSRPPYQFDAATSGIPIAFSQFFGQHGYLPDLVDLRRNVNMHGTFLASGPGVRHRGPVKASRPSTSPRRCRSCSGSPRRRTRGARSSTTSSSTPRPGDRSTLIDFGGGLPHIGGGPFSGFAQTRAGNNQAMVEIIGLIIGGLIVGALGRLINPGPDPMGWIVTILIGIAAMLIVGLLISGVLGWILAVIVAAILVTVVQRVLPGKAPRTA